MQGVVNRRVGRDVLCISAVLAAVTLAAGLAAAQDDVTLAALKLAYGRECNARLHYGAFAARAERDGLPAAALAFRTAAVGESVHAAHHAAHIEELGAVPAWVIESVVIRSTQENLVQAIQNEVGENRHVYRRLVDQASSECQYDALAALNYARTAEGTRAALFAASLQDLELMETPDMLAARFAGFAAGRGTAYYVCMGDGSVFTKPIHGSCPNCGSGRHELRVMAHELTPVRDEARLSADVSH